MSFSFTRNPSVKVSVDVQETGIVPALNTLVIIGHESSSGGSVTAMNVPKDLEAYGDPVAAKAEAEGYFGAGSEIAKMVEAAVKANQSRGVFPPIKMIPIDNQDDASDLAATLAANIAVPMPFVAIPYSLETSAAALALKTHLATISASDRGANAQFGSFGFLASIASDSGAARTAAQNIGSELICAPRMKDTAVSPSNTVAEIAAACAAVCAGNDVPFNPLNGALVGGLVPQANVSDWPTSGDAGTLSLDLAAGLMPLYRAADGTMHMARSITTRRDTANNAAYPDYYDVQDWQVLYYYRQNAYFIASQERYANAKATDQKLKALLSELIALAKSFESLSMFQHVDKLANLFTVTRMANNRFAATYEVPVNVVPGFENKGIAVHGVTKFDSVTLA